MKINRIWTLFVECFMTWLPLKMEKSNKSKSNCPYIYLKKKKFLADADWFDMYVLLECSSCSFQYLNIFLGHCIVALSLKPRSLLAEHQSEVWVRLFLRLFLQDFIRATCFWDYNDSIYCHKCSLVTSDCFDWHLQAGAFVLAVGERGAF